MTAIVGTLNRSGIAFAADSAATYTTNETRKITNNTNKLFELSKKHPVGIAIYNNLSFYGIPWEVIIKTYRDNYLKDNSFLKLSEYINNFWKYLQEVIYPKIQNTDQKGSVAFIIQRLKNESIATAKERLKNEGIEINSQNIFAEIIPFLSKLSKDYSKHNRTSVFKKYKKIQLVEYAGDIIDNLLSDMLQDQACPKNFKQVFIDAFFNIIIADTPVYLSQTGLVFWGYGEEELFPSYYQYEVTLAMDGLIKYVKLDKYEVSNENYACVVPFAQTDVANTVVRGIDQKLRDAINLNLKNAFNNFKNSVVNVLRTSGAPVEILTALNNLNTNEQAESFIRDTNNFISQNYTNKLLDTVAFLSKEDLADMAESLVRMTCLKRHITTDEESVGGPVDVAVITKGDGFVWIKRKNYFPAELNHHYFERQ